MSRPLLATICAALFLATGCNADDTPKVERGDALKQHEQDTGIMCADMWSGRYGGADADNTSGNVCRVRVGGVECVAVLPDDESTGDWPESLVHCPNEAAQTLTTEPPPSEDSYPDGDTRSVTHDE